MSLFVLRTIHCSKVFTTIIIFIKMELLQVHCQKRHFFHNLINFWLINQVLSYFFNLRNMSDHSQTLWMVFHVDFEVEVCHLCFTKQEICQSRLISETLGQIMWKLVWKQSLFLQTVLIVLLKSHTEVIKAGKLELFSTFAQHKNSGHLLSSSIKITASKPSLQPLLCVFSNCTLTWVGESSSCLFLHQVSTSYLFLRISVRLADKESLERPSCSSQDAS